MSLAQSEFVEQAIPSLQDLGVAKRLQMPPQSMLDSPTSSRPLLHFSSSVSTRHWLVASVLTYVSSVWGESRICDMLPARSSHCHGCPSLQPSLVQPPHPELALHATLHCSRPASVPGKLPGHPVVPLRLATATPTSEICVAEVTKSPQPLRKFATAVETSDAWTVSSLVYPSR